MYRLAIRNAAIRGEQVSLAKLKTEGDPCGMSILLKRIRLLAFITLFCIAWLNAGVGRPGEAVRPAKKTVLVLYGNPLTIPANRMIEEGLTAALSSAWAWDLEVFSEYLDLTLFPAARYGDDIAVYLRARYETRKPDVLITVSNTTLKFVLDHRNELFPGVPIVFTAVDHREVEGKEMPPDVTGLWMAWDYQRTLELILQLQPKTREVICVAGSKTTALALRVLAGEKLPLLTAPDPATYRLLINWRALKKWHVSENRIPAEATVVHRHRSLWDQHPKLILATVAVLGLQSLLIMGLIIQRSRLKRAERSLRDSEERMGLAAEAANLGMWVWDVKKHEIWTTDKGRSLLGFKSDEPIEYAAVTARVHPEDRAARNAAIRCALERASRQLWVAWKVARNLKRRKHDDCC